MIDILTYTKPYSVWEMALFKSPEFYDLNNVSKDYSGTVGIQVRFKNDKESKNENLFSQIEVFLKHYFTVGNNNNYLFKSEPNSAFVNKIRTYKGLGLKGNIKEDFYLEKECFISNEETIFLGLINLNENKNLVSTNFWPSGYQFILSSLDEGIFSVKTIERIFSTITGLPGNLYLDYLEIAKILFPHNECALIYYTSMEENFKEILCVNYLCHIKNLDLFLHLIQEALNTNIGVKISK